MNKRIKFFKAISILMIIAGCFAVFSGVLVSVAGLILLIRDGDQPADVINVFANFAGVGIGIGILSGAFQLITGFYSVKNIKNHEKVNIFIHLGAVVAFLSIVSHVWTYISVGSQSSMDSAIIFIGMVVPAFYIISAVQLKIKEETLKDRIPELSTELSAELSSFRKFIIQRKERIFEILFTLIICGIIGWAFETTEVWIHYGRLTARGMLFISRIGDFPLVWGLPFILMYGVGGAILIWCFKPLAKEPIRLFLIGMFVLTIFEYATSVFCEDVLGMKLWDYSHTFMNFQGRVCLSSSLAWGVLSVISVKLLAPLFDKLYNEIMNKRLLHIIIIVLLAFIVICYILRPILNVEQY